MKYGVLQTMKSKKFRFYLVLLFIFFLYFSFAVYNRTYSGITVDKHDNEWIVRQVHNLGSFANHQEIIGSSIIQIDGQNPDSNFLLSRFLIVEPLHSVTVLDRGISKTLIIESGRSSQIIFLVLSIIAFLILLLFRLYIKGRSRGKTGKRYFYFIIYTSLMLLSIIPSSIGDVFGRSLLISYLTLFPLFMDIFIRVLVLKIKGSTISNFSRIILGYSLITQLLYVYNLIQPIDFLTIFFSRGVFYLVFFFLVILLLKMLINYSQIREMLPIHTLFLAVLALFPLFFGYIFPIGKEVSFIYSIPLLLLILFSIVNNLILERLIYVAWKWNPFIYNLIFAVFFTSLIILFSLLLREFSPIFFVLYTFLFSLALLPEIRKMMLISHKMEGIFSSFHTFVATELEREEIATFIHDTTIQKVIYYKKQLEISEQINRIALLEMLDDIVFELRDLCSNIYPLMVHELGLKESITSILNQFMKMETVSIMTTFSIDEEKVNDKVGTFVLRTVKELVNNSILHGNAREITVDLSTKEKILSIEVTDDGIFKGNYQSNEHHFGLNRIVEKVHLLGGTVQINIEPTSVKIRIPIEGKKNDSFGFD